MLILLIATACGSSSPPSPPGPTQVEAPLTFAFRASPVEQSAIDFILPLGNLNPPGHTLPTDHIYFYVGFLRPEIRGVPVFAPGDGTVQNILRSGAPDAKLSVRVDSALTYYVDHVVLDPAIVQGTRLTAGQRLGTSSTAGFGIDLGLVNTNVTLAFVSPARYSGDSLHADAPLRFYEEPLRSQLYALVRREGGDKDGRIDFDVSGRLQGNWFHESVTLGESGLPAAWARQLAFVYDNVQPTQPRVSIGGTLTMSGVFGIDATDPPFDSVTPDSRPVSYRLRRGGGRDGPVDGILLVQMLDSTRIRVEVTTVAAAPAGFTGAAQVYAR